MIGLGLGLWSSVSPAVAAPNLVTNGTFDSSATGWTNATATLAAVGGELQISNQSASPSSATQTISGLTVGNQYRLTVTYRVVSGSAARAAFMGNNLPNNGSSTPLTNSVTVTATTTSASLNLQSFGTSSTLAYFDNVTLIAL